MLASISKGRELKAQQKATGHIQSGLRLVRKKLYKQASLEFNNALKINQDITGITLDKHFKRFKHGGNYGATLAIGLVLLKIKKDDYKLANILGNCSRRESEYKQANDLYRYALRIQKKFFIAYYNLAASMAKVDLYDGEVKMAIERFPPNQMYILPDYAISLDFIDNIVEKLTLLKQKAKDKRLQKLVEERVKREASNELLQVHRIKNKIEEEENSPPTPTYEEVCKYLNLMIKQLSDNQAKEEGSKAKETKEEKQLKLDYHYNMCLYALTEEDGVQATISLEKIRSKGGNYEFYDMMLALALTMKRDVNEGTKLFIELLGKAQTNRFYNVNLGLVYRRLGNKLLSYKYLAIGSILLEKSEGLYKLSDLTVAADEHFEGGRLQKALQLYKVVVAEDENKNAWEKLGKIYLQTEKLEEATEAFRSLQKIDSKSSVAIDYLYQIHDFYFGEGEELFRDRKYKAAAMKFEKAMNVLRLPETLKRAAAVYTVLRDKKRSIELLEECEEIKERLREEEQELLRQSYITKAKKYRKANMFKKSTEFFELAFRLKLDKDVFMFLAHIYKSRNQAEELQDLLNRWNKMVELDDRLKQYKEG